MLYYQRGAEGDNVPESIIGRGPTTEPLVVEVKSSTSDPTSPHLTSPHLTSPHLSTTLRGGNGSDSEPKLSCFLLSIDFARLLPFFFFYVYL